MKRLLPFLLGILGLVILGLGGFFAYRYFAGGSGTLTVWTIAGNEQALKTVAEIYHKQHSAYKVKIVPVNEQVYEFKALYALASQKGTNTLPAPDILVLPGEWLPEHRNKLVAAPDGVLDKAISSYTQDRPKTVTPPPFPPKGRTNSEIIQKDYGPIVASQVLQDNKTWAVPLNMDTLALFYDRRQISTPPKTWQEVSDMTKRFTLRSNSQVTRPIIALGDNESVDYGLDILTTLMLQTGVKLSDPQGRIASFNLSGNGSASGANALDYYTSFMIPSRDVYTWQPSLGSSIKALKSGKTLMALGYASDVSSLIGANDTHIGVAPLPQTNSAAPQTYGQYLAAGVTKQAKQPLAAWDFVSLLANPDVAEQYAQAAGVLPARLDVASRFTASASLKPFLSQVGQAVSWSKEEVQSANKALNDALALVLKKNERPQTALDVTAKAYSAFLQTPSGREADPKVLSLWQTEDDANDYADSIRDYLFSDKNIKQVAVSKHAPDRYEWEIVNAMAAHEGPDILSLRNDTVRRFAATLQPYPAGTFNQAAKRLSDTDYLAEAYAPAVARDGIIDGKLYAMPVTMETLMIAFNTELLRQLASEQLRETHPAYEENQDKFRTGPLLWDDIKTLAPIAVRREGGALTRAYLALGTGSNVAHANDLFAVLLKQYGGDVADPDRQRTGINLPISSQDSTIPGQQALDLLKSFAQAKNDFYTWNNTMPNSLEALADGKVMGAFIYPRDIALIKARNPNIELKFTPLPQKSDNSKPVDSASYYTLTLPLAGKKPASSAQFVRDAVLSDTGSNDSDTLFPATKTRDDTPTIERVGRNPQNIQRNSAISYYKGAFPKEIDQIFIDLNDSRVSLDQAAAQMNQWLKQPVL